MESKPDAEAFGSAVGSPLKPDFVWTVRLRWPLASEDVWSRRSLADSSAGTFRRHAIDRAAVVYDVELALLVFAE